jgi:hypothetical protein
VDDDPLRFAKRLHEESLHVFTIATGALIRGEAEAYDVTMRAAMSLAFSAQWAASAPQLGPQFLAKHGIDLRSREADTQPLRVRVGRTSEGA